MQNITISWPAATPIAGVDVAGYEVEYWYNGNSGAPVTNPLTAANVTSLDITDAPLAGTIQARVRTRGSNNTNSLFVESLVINLSDLVVNPNPPGEPTITSTS